MELMVGFVGDADQQQRHGGGNAFADHFVWQTNWWLFAYAHFVSANVRKSHMFEEIRSQIDTSRTQQKQHSLVSMRTSTHQTLWDPWGNPCDFFYRAGLWPKKVGPYKMLERWEMVADRGLGPLVSVGQESLPTRGQVLKGWKCYMTWIGSQDIYIFWLRTYIYIFVYWQPIKTWDWISMPKDFQSRRLQHVIRKRKLRYRFHILSWNSGWCHTIIIQNSNVPSMALVTLLSSFPLAKSVAPSQDARHHRHANTLLDVGATQRRGFGGARVRNQIFLLSQAKPCFFLVWRIWSKITPLNSGIQ